MRPTTILLAAALVAVALPATAATPPASPKPAMQGGCDAFKADVRAELALWAKRGRAIDAGASPGAAPAAPLDQRLSVRLLPHPQVTPAGDAKDIRAEAEDHSGLLKFRTGRAGAYRIAVKGQVWVDLARNGERMVTDSFEAHAGCPAFSKTVVFDLPADTELHLELLAAKSTMVDVLIHRIAP
jgi:hypothetical protein